MAVFVADGDSYSEQPEELAVADLNDDGHLDLVIVNDHFERVQNGIGESDEPYQKGSALRGDGSGSFSFYEQESLAHEEGARQPAAARSAISTMTASSMSS